LDFSRFEKDLTDKNFILKKNHKSGRFVSTLKKKKLLDLSQKRNEIMNFSFKITSEMNFCDLQKYSIILFRRKQDFFSSLKKEFQARIHNKM